MLSPVICSSCLLRSPSGQQDEGEHSRHAESDGITVQCTKLAFYCDSKLRSIFSPDEIPPAWHARCGLFRFARNDELAFSDAAN